MSNPDPVVGDGHLKQIEANVQLNRDSAWALACFWTFVSASWTIRNKKIFAREQDRLVSGHGERGLDMVLCFVGLEIVRQRRDELHLVVMQRPQVEDHLSRFLDGELQLSFDSRIVARLALGFCEGVPGTTPV